MLSQIDDIPPEQFCHGDNRPPNCTVDCSCIHMIDLPLNAIVEIVLVGLYFLNNKNKIIEKKSRTNLSN